MCLDLNTLDLNTRTIEDHKGLEWRGSSNSASRGGEGRSEVMNVMGRNRLFNRRSQTDSCSCKRGISYTPKGSCSITCDGPQWTFRRTARLAMDVELGECGFQMVPAPTAFTASTVAMLPAVKLRSAEPQTMSMLHSAPAHPKIGQLPR